jgi:hypothetical protein
MELRLKWKEDVGTNEIDRSWDPMPEEGTRNSHVFALWSVR